MILFLSDLDGTLIDSSLTIPPESAAGIQAAIRRGDGFAVATARTPATVGEILAPVSGALPAIVMNGAGIFDFAQNEYLCLHTLSPAKAEAVRNILEKMQMGGFLYTVSGSQLVVYYDRLDNVSKRMFFEARQNKPYKVFRQGSAPQDALRVFYCIIDSEAHTARLAEELRTVPGLTVSHYRDVHDPDCWYVEVYDEAASKAAGVEFLRKYTGCEQVICFGDNLNDLPLLQAADCGYAVANAVPELKAAADCVLQETDLAAVGRFIGTYRENSTFSRRSCGKPDGAAAESNSLR